MVKIDAIYESFKKNKFTTVCGILYVLAAYVQQNPASIAFLGEGTSAFIVSAATFINYAIVAIGFFFASDGVNKDFTIEELEEQLKKEKAAAKASVEVVSEAAPEQKAKVEPTPKPKSKSKAPAKKAPKTPVKKAPTKATGKTAVKTKI